MLFSNENLTAKVKNIFGEDIISSVFINELNKNQADKLINKMLESDITHMQCDAVTLIINFVNNNSIEISISEWATISKLK